jgi:hypothetical protein
MTLSLALNLTSSCLSIAGWVPAIRRWSDPETPQVTYGLWAVACGLAFIGDVLEGSIGWAIFQGSLSAFWAWMWWRNRRKGRMKKVAKKLGAKSRARVQALVDQLTPSPIPAPGGVS